MFSGLPRYESASRALRSGVTYAVAIPEHWEIVRLKSVVRSVVVPVAAEPDDDYLPLERVESWTLRGSPRPGEGESGIAYECGDVLFGKLRPYLAKVLLPRRAGVCVGEFWVLRPRRPGVVPAYLAQLLASSALVSMVDSTTYGSRMPRASWATVGPMRLALPPAEEQAAIVKYLGHAHARIDRAIAAKRKLIALLEEQRRTVAASVLSAHGGATRELKHVLRRLIDCEHKTAPQEDGTDLWILRTSAVRSGEIDWSGAYTTDSSSYRDWTSRATPEAGDVIFTREAPVGEAAVIPAGRSVALGQRTVLMKLRREEMDPRFLVHQIYGGAPRERITLATQGSTVGHFNMDDIGWMRVVVPDLKVQKELVSQIDRVTEKSVAAIDRARREIELLREFRTRLTADAVTGQIDVRAVAATLPDLPADQAFDVGGDDEDDSYDEELLDATGEDE